MVGQFAAAVKCLPHLWASGVHADADVNGDPAFVADVAPGNFACSTHPRRATLSALAFQH